MLFTCLYEGYRLDFLRFLQSHRVIEIGLFTALTSHGLRDRLPTSSIRFNTFKHHRIIALILNHRWEALSETVGRHSNLLVQVICTIEIHSNRIAILCLLLNVLIRLESLIMLHLCVTIVAIAIVLSVQGPAFPKSGLT